MGVLVEQQHSGAMVADRLAGALAACDEALALSPNNVDALAARGATLRAMGRTKDALAALLTALNLAPTHQRARQELALTLRDSGRRREAAALYGLLLRDPRAPADLWHDLALFLLGDNATVAAEICLRRALALAPEQINTRAALADLLVLRDHVSEALELDQDILALQPDNAPANAAAGQALVDLGRLDEAEDRLERALAADPDNALAHMGRARVHLARGNYEAAWEDMDWRWALAGRKRPDTAGAAWDGNTDLSGETILAWSEQGLGETLFLLRFVPALTARGARVILGVPAPLTALATTLDGDIRVAASGQVLTEADRPDFNVALGDLPRLLGIAGDNLPAKPYLVVPPERRMQVTAPLTCLLKVGLALTGSRLGHAIDLTAVMPLLTHPDAAFFNLQAGAPARAVAALAHPSLIADLSPGITDYADLAARMAEMDVVIAADGPAAHLAAALGRPTWILAPATADWRWAGMDERTPWYPTVRIFHQAEAADWKSAIPAITTALAQRIAAARMERDSLSVGLTDERAAETALLAGHARPGDLVLDLGCGSRPVDLPPGVERLAMDARPAVAREAFADSGIKVITAALADGPRPAVVTGTQTKAPRAVLPLPDWVRGTAATLTLDDVLAENPLAPGRRLVIRLGTRGTEAAVLAGLSVNTATAIVFRHDGTASFARALKDRGYQLWRFPTALAAGPLVPFAGESGTVLALVEGEPPARLYGHQDSPHAPALIAGARMESARLSTEATHALMAGQWNHAGALLARALAQDPANGPANANLGVLLRRIGRAEAATACWRRALTGGTDSEIAINLANVLRELGDFTAADSLLAEILSAQPDHPRALYALGLLRRDQGRSLEAVGILERADHEKPGTVPRGELATTLLKAGNLARGMAEMAFRPRPARPSAKGMPWNGGRLEARTILVRDEGDTADTILLARFIPQVARQGGLVVVECDPSLVPVLTGLPGVERVIARGEPLPDVDVVIDLPDVPRLIGTMSRTTPLRDVPYLPGTPRSPRSDSDETLRIGIAWAGSTPERSVPLGVLADLATLPGVTLINLQDGPRVRDLDRLGLTPLVEHPQPCPIPQVAARLETLDIIVGGDTAAMHLAGAMGKPVWAVLPRASAWPWVDGRDDSVWYPTMRVLRQDSDGSWENARNRLLEIARLMVAGKRRS